MANQTVSKICNQNSVLHEQIYFQHVLAIPQSTRITNKYVNIS